MPYFKNDLIHVLHIHIPKTGGTSINHYFSSKYDIRLDKHALYTDDIVNKTHFFNGISLQHQTFISLFQNPQMFSINWKDPTLQIVTVVRNPYQRIVSDMLWHGIIYENANKKEVYEKMKNYITRVDLDNHNKPQYQFISFDNGNLIPNITIWKTENLQRDMIMSGYSDFDVRLQTNKSTKNYLEFLNTDSLRLIHQVYARDFELFNYDMITV